MKLIVYKKDLIRSNITVLDVQTKHIRMWSYPEQICDVILYIDPGFDGFKILKLYQIDEFKDVIVDGLENITSFL